MILEQPFGLLLQSQTGWWLYPGDRCVQIFELNEENEHERMYSHFPIFSRRDKVTR